MIKTRDKINNSKILEGKKQNQKWPHLIIYIKCDSEKRKINKIAENCFHFHLARDVLFF